MSRFLALTAAGLGLLGLLLAWPDPSPAPRTETSADLHPQADWLRENRALNERVLHLERQLERLAERVADLAPVATATQRTSDARPIEAATTEAPLVGVRALTGTGARGRRRHVGEGDRRLSDRRARRPALVGEQPPGDRLPDESVPCADRARRLGRSRRIHRGAGTVGARRRPVHGRAGHLGCAPDLDARPREAWLSAAHAALSPRLTARA